MALHAPPLGSPRTPLALPLGELSSRSISPPLALPLGELSAKLTERALRPRATGERKPLLSGEARECAGDAGFCNPLGSPSGRAVEPEARLRGHRAPRLPLTRELSAELTEGETFPRLLHGFCAQRIFSLPPSKTPFLPPPSSEGGSGFCNSPWLSLWESWRRSRLTFGADMIS